MINTEQYWNERARIKDDKDVLFLDDRRDEYWRLVREQLNNFKINYGESVKVLDVCCGYGQFSDIFDDYTGIDFSEGMIKRKGNEKIIKADARTYNNGEYDVIFEVNSLHSLGWTPEQFFEKYKNMARKIVACLECDKFTIYNLYDR